MTLTIALITGGRDWILDQLEGDPLWQRTRLKSVEGAADALVTIAKRTAISEATALVLPDIKHFYQTFLKINGPPPDDQTDDWYEAHDDGVLNLFEQYSKTLSASWLNYVSTDVRLWQDDEDEKLANSFAQEVWKQLTWQRTTNQILAGVGIVSADLAKYGTLAEPIAEKTEPEYPPMAVNAILNRIMLNMPDPANLASDLDMASDDDDGLALGAAQRLGVDMEAVQWLRQLRARSPKVVDAWETAINAGVMLDEAKHYADLEPGGSATKNAIEASLAKDNEGLPDIPASLVRSALPPLPPPPVAKTALPPLPPPPSGPNASGGTLPPLPPPPAPAAPKGRKPKTPGEMPAGAIAVDVLRAIKDNSGIRDEDLAMIMGVSRPTLGNVMKGKGHYVPSDASRREAIKAMLVEHITALTNAYNAVNV